MTRSSATTDPGPSRYVPRVFTSGPPRPGWTSDEGGSEPTEEKPRAPAPARRRIRRAGFGAIAAGLGYVLVGAACFVLPHDDPLPERSDVAIVLGPLTDECLATALGLLDRGEVGALQLSVWPAWGPDGSPTQRAIGLCDRSPRIHCAVPSPPTTEGEARMLAAGANRHGWRSAVVITQNAHLLRARLILGRCFSGSIAMRASGEGPSGGWPYQFVYQTAATVKALLVRPGC